MSAGQDVCGIWNAIHHVKVILCIISILHSLPGLLRCHFFLPHSSCPAAERRRSLFSLLSSFPRQLQVEWTQATFFQQGTLHTYILDSPLQPTPAEAFACLPAAPSRHGYRPRDPQAGPGDHAHVLRAQIRHYDGPAGPQRGVCLAVCRRADGCQVVTR